MLRGHCFPNSDSSVAYKFRYELCNEFYYGECVRHLTVRSDGILPSYHIGISPLTNRRVQPRKYSAVCHQLLNCNHSFTFEDFSVLYYESKKYLLELKDSLFIMRDRLSMNQNTHSGPLYLFKWVFVTLFAARCGLLRSVF